MFLDENSAPVLADSALCKICNALDLDQMLREGVESGRHSITLGALAAILSKKHICGLWLDLTLDLPQLTSRSPHN